MPSIYVQNDMDNLTTPHVSEPDSKGKFQMMKRHKFYVERFLP